MTISKEFKKDVLWFGYNGLVGFTTGMAARILNNGWILSMAVASSPLKKALVTAGTIGGAFVLGIGGAEMSCGRIGEAVYDAIDNFVDKCECLNESHDEFEEESI